MVATGTQIFHKAGIPLKLANEREKNIAAKFAVFLHGLASPSKLTGCQLKKYCDFLLQFSAL